MLFTTLLERLLKGFYRNSNAFLFDFKHVVECVKRETSSKNSTAVKQMMKTALVIEEIVKSESVGSVPSQLQSQLQSLQSQHTSASTTTTVASSMDDSVNTTTTRRTGSSSSSSGIGSTGSTGTGSTGTATIPPSSVLSGGGITTTTIPVKPSTKTSTTTTTTGTTASAPPLLDSTKLDVSKKKAKTTTSHKDMKELAQPSSVQTNTTTSTTTSTHTTTLTTNTPKKQVHKMAEKSPKKKSTESSLITISGTNEEKSTIGGGSIQKEMKSKQQGGTPVETSISLQQPHALNNIARPMSTNMKDDEETDSSDEEMTLKLSTSSNSSSNTSTRHTTMSVPLLNTSALSHNNNSSSTSSNSSSITNTTTGNVDTTKTINDHIQSYLGTSQNYLPDIPKIASKKQEMIGNTRKQEMIGNTSMMTNIPTMSDMTTASTTTNTIQPPPPPPLHSLKDLPTIQKKKSTTEESQKTKHEETTLEKKKKKSQKKKHEESQDKKKKKTISTSTTTTTSTNNAEPFKIKIKLDNEPTPSAAYSSTSGVLQPPLPTTMLDPTTTTTTTALSSLTAPATTQLPDTSSMKIPKKKEFTCTTDVVSTPGQWDSKSNNITLENHETIPPQVDISQTKPLDTMMDVGHGFTEDGFLTTETATTESTAPSTRVKSTMEPTTSHRITIPPITLKKKNHVKQYLESSCFSENRDDESTAIVTDDTENVYHEIIVKLTPIENGSKIKVQLESNPKFDQTQAEKRREWCKLLENNFKNIGTTTSQQIMSQIYGSSKRMNKTSTSSAAYSSLMDLSLPIFTTHKEFIIYRDEIPTIDFIPKSLFERQKDIYLYQQRHSLRIENIKTSITHLQIHVIREESQFMDTDEYNDRICNKISINIQCSMTEPDRIQFYSLFDKVSEARAICKNTKLLFAHPQPHTLFELCDKFGFLVDDVFDWFVEGFYFKRRVGRNPNLVSPNAKYLILDFVYLHDCTEVELNTQ
ncbi:hypothetical protein C9374_003770 [Naegleria lovaniensis]|uniref:Uncharacterized protein n=1 Tax=Naegleria lovaniensis TaxID=51637 RepID=A0AA88H5G6_NAELO|nr:uncharacterized protein C9374_003770 [Naegleria lovaniensis]KAG2394006.1 hypothetical protein C9374_003770 [Naegleria lovaniensis]